MTREDNADAVLPLPERLALWLEQLAHVLPAQAPIRDFVHHNTLHGFQHLPFAEALARARQLTGANPYWPEARFHACYAAGRINDEDLLAALTDFGLPALTLPLPGDLTQTTVLLASLLCPTELADVSRCAWLQREQGGADDSVLRRCLALTAEMPLGQTIDSWQEQAARRWMALCQQVGQNETLGSLLEHLSGEAVLERVWRILQRHLAAHLDLGVAAWSNPAQAQGFFAAWRASAGVDLAWELDELPHVRDEIMHLLANPLEVLAEELARLLPDETCWYGYLQRLCLELPGWSGMFLWRDRHAQATDAAPVAMLDYLAVRVLLERLLCDDLMRRLTGGVMTFAELRTYYATHPGEFFVRDTLRHHSLPEALQHRLAAVLAISEEGRDEVAWDDLAAEVAAALSCQPTPLAQAWRLVMLSRQLGWSLTDLGKLTATGTHALFCCADGLDTLQRSHVWLLAYERHYREQLLAALSVNHPRQQRVAEPTAQVVFCMDDREEGMRRHLEEIAPDIVTYGAAGFFGVAMYWQGLDDDDKSALCPVVVQPRHWVREVPASAAAEAFTKHLSRRAGRLRWREQLYQTTRRASFGGTVLTALAAVPALAVLTAATLAPGWVGKTARRWRTQYDGVLATELALTAEMPSAGPAMPLQAGFTDAEQIERVEAFLRSIGLCQDFAPLVLMFGHGSSSRNNPHASAYACGACSGRHGGPNARVFARMANRPAVRAGLAERGLHIPATTWFIAAEHNTCDDSIEWYDLAQVPPAWQAALDRLLARLAAAARAHAVERCRRLASAPLRPAPWQGQRHVCGRANDGSQARPELGHATNAAAFIGRRAMSRGLFLDRRVFLISYDPLADADGQIVESILLAAGPVGAGISLEYYFSSVDNQRFGCGSKITHNITGLFGVMEGAASDLRTGLPWQMVEIHEPMRLLVVVEQLPEVLTAILSRQPPLQVLINNAWITLAAKNPSTAEIHYYCPRRGWLPWSGRAVLPQVACSADWFAGASDALPPALLLGQAIPSHASHPSG